jgi:hypothetical protein
MMFLAISAGSELHTGGLQLRTRILLHRNRPIKRIKKGRQVRFLGQPLTVPHGPAPDGRANSTKSLASLASLWVEFHPNGA